MGLTMLIGFAGGLAVLVSFAGVARGRFSAHCATYHAMNLTGALTMVAAGLPADASPSTAAGLSSAPTDWPAPSRPLATGISSAN